ncbi:MAG: FAD-dependent oxidoreductase [Candidatus Hadarchaeota archaeon]
MYELIIIGGGPAGITASIYAARKRLNFLVIAKDIGGQAAISLDIENYTGYQYITGEALRKKFEEHVKEFQINTKFEDVLKIEKVDGGFRVTTTKGNYETMAVIIATGARPRGLNIPGEKEFTNRGVTYCATCDAPLFADMDVAVIGGGNNGLMAAMQLSRIAKKIYLIEVTPKLTGDETTIEKVMQEKKVTVMTETMAKEISGDNFVTGLVVERQGKIEKLKVQGIFVEIGYTPLSSVAKDLVNLNARGEIIVDNACRTSVDGVFAAGDVSSVPEKQIIVAAGDGAKATLSAYKYLQRLKRG